MFEYTFVSAPVVYERNMIAASSYERVIHEHAAQGWRLVQVFVPLPAAVPTEYIIIFERPAQQETRASS